MQNMQYPHAAGASGVCTLQVPYIAAYHGWNAGAKRERDRDAKAPVECSWVLEIVFYQEHSICVAVDAGSAGIAVQLKGVGVASAATFTASSSH
jgi:hypothetical protein